MVSKSKFDWNKVPVVNSDGTPYVRKWYNISADWLWDHCYIWRWSYRIWRNHLRPFIVMRKIKHIFQRVFRGFSDRECWCLDDSFHKWLYPRLKRFSEITCAFPNDYSTFEKWKKDLNSRIEQLRKINEIDEYDFNDYRYIPKSQLELWLTTGMEKSTLNSFAYDYCVADFDKWFGKRVKDLWY